MELDLEKKVGHDVIVFFFAYSSLLVVPASHSVPRGGAAKPTGEACLPCALFNCSQFALLKHEWQNAKQVRGRFVLFSC